MHNFSKKWQALLSDCTESYEKLPMYLEVFPKVNPTISLLNVKLYEDIVINNVLLIIISLNTNSNTNNWKKTNINTRFNSIDHLCG